MNPQSSRPPRKWTPAENDLLQEKVEECKNSGKPTYWPEVAAAFRDRSKDDCRKRWAKMDERWKRGAWDRREDELLSQSVQKYGCRWTEISKTVGTRSPDQCAKRWRNALNPDVTHSEWTEEDDATLTKAVQNHGRDWKTIHDRYLPERSRLDLSNRYVSLCRQQKKKQRSQSSPRQMTTQVEDRNSSMEPDQSFEGISSSPGGSMKQSDPFLQNVTMPSLEDDTITSWISQETQADHMDFFDPHLFPGPLGHYESQITQEHDDLFTNMNAYQENHEARPPLTPHNSSTSLFPLFSTTMNASTWMDLDHSTSNVFPSSNDLPQLPSSSEGQATLSDVTEAVTPPSPHEIPFTHTPTEKGKTVLTLENLNAETRSEVLDWLCKRKIVTTIEIV